MWILIAHCCLDVTFFFRIISFYLVTSRCQCLNLAWQSWFFVSQGRYESIILGKNSEKLNLFLCCLSKVYSWLHLYFSHICIFYINFTQHLPDAALLLKYYSSILPKYCETL